jgi:tetratricopeptide (TPR) repeat protein
MNKLRFLVAVLLCCTLIGCSKRFGPLFEKAQQMYAEKKWIETIDNINLALPFWRESDGRENKAQAYQLLGKAYHELKKIDKAIESYTKAVELSTNANTYDAAYSLGVIYLTANQPAPAVNAFKEALGRKKDDPWALIGLGNAYFAAGNYREARFAYQRVIDSSPGVRESLEYLKLIDEKARAPKKTVFKKRQIRGAVKKL